MTTTPGAATRWRSSTRRWRRRSSGRISPRRRWSSWLPMRFWPRRSRSSTRSPTCASTRAPTCWRSRAGWGWTERIGPQFLKPGIGFGGSCFPKDVSALKQLAGNSGYPLPAAHGGDRGERAAEAPGGRQAAEAPWTRWRASESLCWASLSRPTPTTCARRRRSCSPPACRQPAPSVSAYDPIAQDEARALLRGVRLADSALDAVAGSRRLRARHRVAGVPRAGPPPRARADDQWQRDRRRPQLHGLRRGPQRRASSTRAIGRGAGDRDRRQPIRSGGVGARRHRPS